jgi:hypothetical protein
MATTYNSTDTYDGDSTRLYDGATISGIASLIVAGVNVTAELARGSLRVRQAIHGNSLGTLDARLNGPARLPVTEDGATLYIGTAHRFEGTVRATTVEAMTRPGTDYLTAGLSAQDAGPAAELPTAAPWNLSDTPNGTTTHGYRSLTRSTRTTEGGSPQTTYTAVVKEAGLWVNQNIEVTHAAYGLSAVEFTIREVSLSWPIAGQPEYTLTLGDPLVSMAQLVRAPNLTPGSITETEISDGAISTPKLAATAVIANVVNVSNTVRINSQGIRVTGGAITVENAGGTVVIDGSSDHFRIVASGSFSLTGCNGTAAQCQATTNATINTGLTTVPVHIGSMDAGDGTSRMLPRIATNATVAGGGGVTDQYAYRTEVVSGAQTKITLSWFAQDVNRSGTTLDFRYYILAQQAI